MGVIGIDVGIRSFAMVHLSESGFHIPMTYSVPKGSRWYELQSLSNAAITIANDPDDICFIEEPPLAGSRNVRTALQLAQTCGALLGVIPVKCYLTSVGEWKKTVVGKGNATKEEVGEFLNAHFPELYELCSKDQNLIDATCIALYGDSIVTQFL
jgi:Holliday junction resolvasome RuvABC endonuclease subunit